MYKYLPEETKDTHKMLNAESVIFSHVDLRHLNSSWILNLLGFIFTAVFKSLFIY